jgi:hypothetical protein
VKELHHRGVHTDPIGEIKPVKYKGFDIPHQFVATFYLIDNDNVKVTKANLKTFKTWQAKLYIRVTKSESVEVVRTDIIGASTYKGHSLIVGEEIDPFSYGTVQARHYTAIKDYRTRLVSVAVQVAIQSHRFTKRPDGTYSVTIGDKIDIPIKDLERINSEVSEETYAKLDDAFYRRVAEIYKKAVLEGDRPNRVLMQELNKGLTTVQGYTKVCRDMGLLSEAPLGKASPVRKPATKRKKG